MKVYDEGQIIAIENYRENGKSTVQKSVSFALS